MELLPLLMIFLFAQTLEVFLGFGGTLFALVLGSYFYDINSVLVFLIPLNMLLNLSVIYKDKYFIDFKLLFKKILPLMGVGIIMSLLVTPAFPKNIQYMFVGGALVVCALRALITSRLESEVEKSNNPLIEKAFYLMGGYAQAALGSGGPFISLHITNQKINARAARGTLASLWFILNLFLFTTLINNGANFSLLTINSFSISLILIPIAVLLGNQILKLVKETLVIKAIGNMALIFSGIQLILNAVTIV